MALKTVITTATSHLLSASKSEHSLRGAGATEYDKIETIQAEAREWVALAESTAATAVTNKTGEAQMTMYDADDDDITYENSMQESNRGIGAYTYQCSAQKKSVAIIPV